MGKKRKHESPQEEQEQQQYYEKDTQAVQFDHLNHQQRSDSGSRVEPETVAYLSEVAEHLATIHDPEEKQLLVGNVLEEIQGKELRIASDAVTSRLLEQFLVGAPAAQLMQFLEAFTNEDMMFSLAGSAFGSHVAEKVLAGLHMQAEQLEGEQAAHLEQLLAGMVGAIGSNLFDYIMDKHATHVARALLVVIAGRDVLSHTGKKQQQAQQAAAQQEEQEEQDPSKAAAAAAAAQGNRPAFKASRNNLQEKIEGNRPQQRSAAAGTAAVAVRYPKLLSRYAKMLPCYDASNMTLLGKNSYSSPFLQAMLRAAAADEELLQLLLPPILGVDAAKAAAAEPGSVLATLTDSHVGRLLRDDVYSHLLEVAVAVMPQQQQPQGDQQQQQSLAAEFYQRFLRGRLLPLSNHHSANFVIQAWLAASSSPGRVTDVLTELGPHLTDLLKRRRSGVLTALVGAAARAGPGAHQAAVAEAVAAALTGLPQWQGREGTDHLAPALMTMDSNVTMGSSGSSGSSGRAGSSSSWSGSSGGGRLSTPGCAILATLLQQYPRKVSRPFIASVMALNPADAARAAKDPSGSRALQALVEGPAGQEAKATLLQKLAGSWADVALQAAGSFFLEKAYAWADLDQKDVIVREVAGRQSALMTGCYWGPKLAKKLGLEAYMRSPDEWRKRAASSAAASKAFEDLLSLDTGPTAAAKGDGAHGRKKKKKQRQQEQELEGGLDGQQLLAAALGAAVDDGSKKTGSKKAKKKAGLVQQGNEAAAADASAAAALGAEQPGAEAAATPEKRKKRQHLQSDADAAGTDGTIVSGSGAGKDPAAIGPAGEQQQQPQPTRQKKSSTIRKRDEAAGGSGGGSIGDVVALGREVEGSKHSKRKKK